VIPRRTRDARQKARIFGLRAERLAVLLLRLKGYSILDCRFNVRGGEIDIVARRGEIIAFVEVKVRQSLDDAFLAIDAAKRRHLSHAVKVWLSGHPWAVAFSLRGDAIYIAPWRWPRHLCAAIELKLD
jgi:putative endonuclease